MTSPRLIAVAEVEFTTEVLTRYFQRDENRAVGQNPTHVSAIAYESSLTRSFSDDLRFPCLPVEQAEVSPRGEFWLPERSALCWLLPLVPDQVQADLTPRTPSRRTSLQDRFRSSLSITLTRHLPLWSPYGGMSGVCWLLPSCRSRSEFCQISNPAPQSPRANGRFLLTMIV